MKMYFNEINNNIYINTLGLIIYTHTKSKVQYVYGKVHYVIIPQTSLICTTEVSEVYDDVAVSSELKWSA